MYKIFMSFLILLFAYLQYDIWLKDGGVRDLVHLNEAIQLQNKDIEKLKIRNEQLNAEVIAIKTQPQALEERARSELGLIKPNETFFLVIEAPR
jgi:cell division protein FtsB